MFYRLPLVESWNKLVLVAVRLPATVVDDELLPIVVLLEPVELDRVKRPDKASSEETPPAAPPVQLSKDNVPLQLDT